MLLLLSLFTVGVLSKSNISSLSSAANLSKFRGGYKSTPDPIDTLESEQSDGSDTGAIIGASIGLLLLLTLCTCPEVLLVPL
jgi:hypothetical protein